MDAPRRFLRAGLFVLRPRVSEGADPAALMRPEPWPLSIGWRSTPALEPLQANNSGLSPREVVKHLVERAGGGALFNGLPLEERLAFTSSTKNFPIQDRFMLAKDYVLLGPLPGKKPGEQVVTVVYRGLTFMDSSGAMRLPAQGYKRYQAVLVHTEEGWKLSPESAPPDVMLAARSRFEVRPPASERDKARREAEEEEAVDDARKLAFSYGQHGLYREALDALAPFQDSADPKGGLAYDLACWHARVGETKLALGWLQKAIERGWRKPDVTERDEDLKSLREQPEFKELIARMRAAPPQK